MTEDRDPPVAERLARLEERVDKLQQTLKSLIDALALRERGMGSPRPESSTPTSAKLVDPPRPPNLPEPTPNPPERPAKPPGRTTAVERPRWYVDRGSQFWLNKIGIALVLFGVVFLFRYSVDQGWLTRQVRIGLGFALGVVLCLVGLRTYRKRPWFGRVLVGGAIATFYITTYAAFQLFALVSYGTALALIAAVSTFAFGLALWQNEATPSVIGTVGALATPFLLVSDVGTVSRLASYVSIVIATTAAIFLLKGWRSLLWTAVFGGWGGLVVGLTMRAGVPPQAGADALALQISVLIALAAFWMIPIIRMALQASEPDPWQTPFTSPRPLLERHAHILTVVTPVAALVYSMSLWQNVSPTTWGWIAAAGAALDTGAYIALLRWGLGQRLAYTHAIAATVLLTISAGLLLDGGVLLVTWSVEAVALHLIAQRLSDPLARIGGHVLSIGVAVWLLQRVTGEMAVGWPVLNAQALTDVVVLATVLVSANALTRRDHAALYRFVGYAAAAAWLSREMDGGVLLLCWALLALALLVSGSHRDEHSTALAGHALFILVAVWLSARLATGQPDGGLMGLALPSLPIVNAIAIADAVVIALGLTAARVALDGVTARFYYLLAHLAILGWVWRELSTLPNGNGLVTLTWGLYAAGLLLPAIVRRYEFARVLGIGTLVLVVAKLFFVDLARVDPLWRVMLFLGFGGLFLVLSYVRDLWQEGD